MLTPEDKLHLAASAEFQRLLEEDPELRALDGSAIDYDRERLLFWEVLGGTELICGVEVSPITPAVWAHLWLVHSPLCSGKTPEFSDVATALYLLTHSTSQSRFDKLPERSAEFAKKISLTDQNAPDVWKELVGMVERTFSPLSMLPHVEAPVGAARPDPVFDTDWLLSVCSVASQEAGITLQAAAINFPLSAVFALMVIRARKANPDTCISRHTPEYIGKRILERTEELGEYFMEQELEKWRQ